MQRKGTPLYTIWANMRDRCKPWHPRYKDYGGRGIFVCKQWDESYEQFATDVGPHPGKSWTLDRIDNNKGYEPSNVRWATRTIQSRNRRCTKLDPSIANQIKLACKKYTQRDVAAQFGVSQRTVCVIFRGEAWK